MKIIFGLLICLISVTTFATPEKQLNYSTIKISLDDDKMIVFETCDVNGSHKSCETLAKFKEFDSDFNPLLRKGSSIILGIFDAWAIFAVNTAAALVTTSGRVMFAAGAGVFETAVATAATVFIDSLNPLFHWDKANVQTQLEDNMKGLTKPKDFVEFFYTDRDDLEDDLYVLIDIIKQEQAPGYADIDMSIAP